MTGETTSFFVRIKRALMGAPLDPFKADTRQHLALITFFAWVGVGADAISSANYGPEEAFLALGAYTHLAVFLAIATAFTVFLLAAAYSQVIELFPNGGGGYRVATTLLSPKVGLVSGGALLIDYVLTIAISAAASVDALFSLLPVEYQGYKLAVACLVVVFLTYMNLRGVKESIKILLPIFMGFILTHATLIIVGIAGHSDEFLDIMPRAVEETSNKKKKNAATWRPRLAGLPCSHSYLRHSRWAAVPIQGLNRSHCRYVTSPSRASKLAK